MPDLPFTKAGAFMRNQALVALSEAVIAVEPGDTGGTWHSIKHAVKMNRPLYYHEGARNDLLGKLKDSGAVRIELEDGEPVMDGFFSRGI
jgi:predicted Rossmann fold nucleotide-binding protein DprA/Smf involved in DNA uptake